MISDLSEYLPYDRILAVAGVSVKGSVPDITACPLCKRPSLTVYNDPVLRRSKWLRCGSCRFSGDTVEAYQRISRAPTLIEALYAAKKNGLCEVPRDEFTPAHIQTYVDTYPNFRRKVSDVWDRLSRGTLENVSPDLIRHAQNKHLWHGWLSGPHKRMTRFLGGGERRMIDELFIANFGKRVLPRKGFGIALAVPYQDVPGRICGIRFMGRDEDMDAPLSPHKNDTVEGGLAMLDALDGVEKTVYAVSRLDFALQFHRLHFSSHQAPLKMIAYTEETDRAWEAVHAERVIFWSDEVDWRLFRQVKRFDNGWISLYPKLREAKRDIYVYTREQTPEVILNTLETSALPWPRFVAEWLTDKKRDPIELRATLSSTLFSSRDIERIVQECPEKDREKLRNMLRESSSIGPEEIVVQGKKTFARDDGWYAKNREGDSLITDAVVKLTHEAVDTGMGEVYWYGEIQYRKHRVVFAGEPFREIESKPMEWLRDKTARVGLGFPRFDKSFARNFTNLVKSFNPNCEVVQVTDRLGINKSGEIIFPDFSLKDGEAVPRTNHLPMPDAPALEVRSPALRDVAKPEPITAARGAWYAAAAAYVMRLLELANYPVYITEEYGSSGISAFMKSAGMCTRELYRGNAEEKSDLTYFTRKYNYPVHLRAADTVLAKLPYESFATCFVSTQRLTAMSLCTQREGIVLKDAVLDETEKLPPFDDVVWYLAYLQRKKFELEELGNPAVAVLRGFCRFMEEYLSHFDQGHAAISTSRMRLCAPGQSLVELVVLLCLSGKLGREYIPLEGCLKAGFAPSMGRLAACVDIEGSRVYLPRKAIIRACGNAGIPRPDLFNAEKDLSEKGLLLPNTISDGLLISTELWNQTVKGCRSELNQTP